MTYTILVCDDDKAIVDAIEIYLTQEKYHVLKAYDGLEALKVLKYCGLKMLLHCHIMVAAHQKEEECKER